MVKNRLSIVIPARTEKYLNHTIQSVLDNATGDIEIFPVLDGYPDDYPYERIIDPRVRYITLPPPLNLERRKRMAVNTAISISSGEYVMWLDGHCVVAKGFDEVLKRDCEDNMVMIPRRRRVDVPTWSGKDYDDSPPIDYEYWMWRDLNKGRLKNYKWNNRSIERKDIMIDDIFCVQASLIFMTRKWYDHCGFMKVEGYTGWGQEGEEMCLETIKRGGRAVVNKNTWYAHLRKGEVYGRMYKTIKGDIQPSYDYAFNHWMHDNKDFIIRTLDRFMPIPNYPEDWADKLYANLRLHKK